MLLIHPPHTKPSEPPAGIPMLAGALRQCGYECVVCDLNIEAFHVLIDSAPQSPDTWSRRAWKNRHRNVEALQSPAIYHNPSKYSRAVADINRIIENCGKQRGIHLSLSNYQDPNLSPLNSSDLITAANQYRTNIYHDHFASRLTELIITHSPTAIGFSLNFLSQALCTFAMLGFVRDRFPQLKIILGGGLVTTWMQKRSWNNPFADLTDHLVSGPGIEPLFDILDIKRNTPAHPAPDFSDLHDSPYLAPGFILPYSCSSGCFWRKCAFCPETSEKNDYRPIPVDTVRRDLAHLTARTSPTLIHLLDNAISPALLKSFRKEPLSAPWYGFVRFTKHLADREFCRDLKGSGCVMLKLGLESGNQYVLDGMNKGIDLELARKSLATLHRSGILTYVYLLFGTPGESEQQARDTLHFVSSCHQYIDFLNLAVFNMPIDSRETADHAVHEFYEGDLSIYCDFEHPQGWSRKKIRRFLDNEFRKDPSIRKILQRDPPQFTSNHAPLFGLFPPKE